MSHYVGRFAPSPTGELHFGSLVTAVASYLRARAQRGRWLLRIEDLDKFRCKSKYTMSIIKTLEAHGLNWDGDVVFQSNRNEIYRDYLKKLNNKNLLYNCYCSRKTLLKYKKNLNTHEVIYEGFCRHHPIKESLKNFSIRIKIDKDEKICFYDLIQGELNQNIYEEVGDFVVWRRENLPSYQLAVVIDDELQGVTEVVRGSDLLLQTPRQILLQRFFSFDKVQYLHIPIAVNKLSQKLSKQTKAKPIDNNIPKENLIHALEFLGYQKSLFQDLSNLDLILQTAIRHFKIENITKCLTVIV
ncbi:tRNA glutamyl-Q(34) synthetase GluQRS [Spirobacillus cienkowskii]|uniref:tRNA glutamyl-Q(34) synthetase GluQRS n=1 Tax=Spirobacillus cienkowskii TaxID=495820 RepID=UPI0030CFAC62